MNKMLNRLCALGLAALSFALLGCGTQNAANGKKIIHVGGTLDVTDSTMDPAKEWAGWFVLRCGIGETLFRLDDEMRPQPWLAERAENISPTDWRITLKDNVVFSNGEKMTAEKVAASLQRTAEINQRAAWLRGAEYTADGDVLAIRTKEPYATLVNDLCDPYAIILDVAGTEDFDQAPVATGPFTLASYEPYLSAVMTRNEHYWDGAVRADGVTYTKIPDPAALAMALESGEIDAALDLSPENAETIAASDKFTLVRTPQTRVYQLYMNLDRLTDPAVRTAIMCGIDKDIIGTQYLKGAMTAANGAFLPSTPYRAPAPLSYDLSKAHAFLAAAGYQDSDGDGIVEKDGVPLIIGLSIYRRLSSEAIATEIQSQLRRIGIKIEVDPHEKASFFNSGDFDLGIYSVVTMPTGDPYAFLRDAMGSTGVANYGHYHSAAADQALSQLAVTFDPAQRIQLVNQIQQQVIDDRAMDFIGFNTMQVGMAKGLRGLLSTPSDYYQVTKDLDKE